MKNDQELSAVIQKLAIQWLSTEEINTLENRLFELCDGDQAKIDAAYDKMTAIQNS